MPHPKDEYTQGRKNFIRILNDNKVPPDVCRGLSEALNEVLVEKSQLKERVVELNAELARARAATGQALAHSRKLTGQLSQVRIDRGSTARNYRRTLHKARVKHEKQLRDLQKDLAQACEDRQRDTLTLRDELTQTHAGHAMEVKRLKNELTKVHADHAVETMRLQGELEQARANYSGDDDLVKLYHAGAGFFTKQAAQIKSLKAEVQHKTDEHVRLERSFTLKLAEKDNENVALAKAVRQLEGRLASLTTGSTEAEADSKRKVAVSQDQLKAAANSKNQLQGKSLIGTNLIEDPRRRDTVKGNNVDLFDKLRKAEHQCEGYRSVATEQQELIERLWKENTNLLRELGQSLFFDKGR